MSSKVPLKLFAVVCLTALIAAACAASDETEQPLSSDGATTTSERAEDVNPIQTPPAQPPDDTDSSSTTVSETNGIGQSVSEPEETTGVETTADNLSSPFEKEIAELIVAAERIRGLKFLEQPNAALLSPDDFNQRFEKFLGDRFRENEVEGEELYKLLGLLDKEYSLKELFSEMLTETVTGYYDSEAGELVVPVRGDAVSPYTRMVLLHELVHALTDQHFRFTELADQLYEEGKDDERLALSALVEGDANLMQARYFSNELSAEEQAEVGNELTGEIPDQEEPESSSGGELPHFMLGGFLFPYTYGVLFVRQISPRGDLEAINAAYKNPPTSTEQIYFPSNFPDETPLEVPHLAIDIPGYELARSSSWGQAAFAVMFDQVLGAWNPESSQNRASVRGWGGDRYSYWRDGAESAFALTYRGDEAKDASELFETLQEYVTEAMDVGSPEVSPESVTWRGEDFAWVSLSGDVLRFVAASVPEVGDFLVSAYSASGTGASAPVPESTTSPESTNSGGGSANPPASTSPPATPPIPRAPPAPPAQPNPPAPPSPPPAPPSPPAAPPAPVAPPSPPATPPAPPSPPVAPPSPPATPPSPPPAPPSPPPPPPSPPAPPSPPPPPPSPPASENPPAESDPPNGGSEQTEPTDEAENLAGRFEEQITELIEATERIRGLEFLEKPNVTLLTLDDFRGRLQGTAEESFVGLTAEEALMKLLGLLDKNSSLAQLQQDLYTGSVAGYYDTYRAELVVPMRGDGLGIYDRIILFHELIHALTDQHFKFGERIIQLAAETKHDAGRALRALIEGDASVSQTRYILSELTTAELLELRETLSAREFEAPTENRIPHFVLEPFNFQYSYGSVFVRNILREGGLQALDSAYRSPPVSTEQIVSSQKYPDEIPLEVDHPEVDIPGYSLHHSSTWGELGLAMMFHQIFPTLASEGGGTGHRRVEVRGWGGDRYSLWFDGSDAVFALTYRGDTRNDTAELASALREYIPTAMAVGNPYISGNTTTWQADDFAWLSVSGDELKFVAASDPDAAAPILTAYETA